ncbi:hypothetical protein ACEN33_00610 [Ruoffia sp. FAM 24228]|uniref:hypothetical protein n=1 Tax=Ruoffia sp. FAM 24228 TaxID=3259517 RepID=UPI0038858FBB
MKKIAKMLLASSCLLVGTSLIPSVNEGSVNSVYAEEEYSYNDIFSEDYPEDYDVYVRNGWINRIVNEIKNKYQTKEIETRYISKDSKEEGVGIKFDDPNIKYAEDFGPGYDFYVRFSEKEDTGEEFIEILLYEKLNGNHDLLYNLALILDKDANEDDFKRIPEDKSESGSFNTSDTSEVEVFYGEDFKDLMGPGTGVRMNLTSKLDNSEIKDLSSIDSDRLPDSIREKFLEEQQEVTPVEPEPEEEAFNPDSYEIIAYEDIMRDRSGKLGTKHTFYAEVLQYFEDGDNAMAMLMRNGDSDMIYQAYFTSLPENRLVEGDDVDVYGILTGLQGYETVRGSENTTPVIFIDEILIKGIDY